MMRRRASNNLHSLGRVNVTPMIDVIMCLIVFYLIVGKLVADQRSDVRLPPARSGTRDAAQDLFVVNVLPGEGSARIVVDRREIEPRWLGGVLRERLSEKPGSIIQVRASRELRYADLRPVLDACREAGVEGVRLSAEEVR